MSQLFDSLRRGPARQVLPKSPRTAHGDAVLATLGYAPARGVSATPSGLVRAGAVLGVIVAALAGWRFYHPATALPPRSAVQPRQAQAAPPSSTARPSPSMSPSLSPPAVAPLPSAGTPAPAAPAPPAVAMPSSAAAGPRTSGNVAERRESSTLPARPVHDGARPRPPAPLPISRPEDAPVPGASTSGSTASDFELALYYHRAGDFENALQHYRALLQKNELDAQAHNNLGLLYQEKNLLGESARELRRAVLIEPRNARAHNNFGVTLLRQHKTDEAAAEFRVAANLEPRNVDALVNLALAQKDGGRPDVAKETLLRALTIVPRSAEAHYNLALVYDDTNELARAADHYRAFLENAGPDRADRAAAVRARVAALTRIPD